MRCIALLPDAFGGKGGIAQYNRDFLLALAKSGQFQGIAVLPRHCTDRDADAPAGIIQMAAVPGRVRYCLAALQLCLANRPDVIFCGHILMSPLCALLAQLTHAKLWLQVHGIDAWRRPGRVVRWGAERSDLITSVSRFTRDQMLRNWARIEPWRVRVLPNTVREEFLPGPAPEELRRRYSIGDRRVLLTVSRISRNDAYKGHDRVIQAVKTVLKRVPDLVYLIVGEGDDVKRLKKLACDNGVEQHVIFAGHVADHEMIDHFRLATAFVMPSTKEGFGIVFLEAARCGIPVIGGNKDGTLDALRNGLIGSTVDPDDIQSLSAALESSFSDPQFPSRTAVDVFSRPNFDRHVAALSGSLAIASQ